MIVQKKQDEQGNFVPDVPAGYEYKSAIYVRETDNYKLVPTDAMLISPAQGKAELASRGLLQTVEAAIEASNDQQLKIFWNFSTFWEKHTPAIMGLASQLGIDINDFWTKAKAREL